MKVAILSIGTELTTGQITNTNATWFAKKFKSLGIDSQLHLTVPDDKKLILESFEFCIRHADFIFVTGGLGPTSDDFTRIVFSEWAQKKLVWHEDSWSHIHDRLVPRGISVKEIQKQQCYYPEGSTILKNKMGTANGFKTLIQVKDLEKCFYFLPGPPREIQSIWEDHIESEIALEIPAESKTATVSWDTLGIGESDVAEKVVHATRGLESVLSRVDIGYRVHLPYVEVKLSYLETNAKDFESLIQNLEKSLESMTVLRNGEDIAESLTRIGDHFGSILIFDEIPGSFLMQRLFPFAKNLLKNKKLSFLPDKLAILPVNTSGKLAVHLPENSDVSSALSPTVSSAVRSAVSPHENLAETKSQHRIVLHLKEFEAQGTFQAQASIEVYQNPQNGDPQVILNSHQNFNSNYKMPLMREREQQFFAESAMIFWVQALKKIITE